KHVSGSVFSVRALTSLFSAALICSFFGLFLRYSGPWAAALASAMLLAAPRFLSLSSTCMLEIPALSLAVSALFVLSAMRARTWPFREILTGVLFGLSSQMKLVPLTLIPVAFLLLWNEKRAARLLSGSPPARGDFARAAAAMLVICVSLAFTYVAAD